MRPLNYFSGGTVLGHYAVSQRSGEIGADTAAAAYLGSIRWTDTTRYLVLMRLKIGWSVSTAWTTAVEMAFKATVVRGFSVDFTVGTAISMGGVSNTNKMRSTMGTSLMGVNGPRIATTVTQSGQTLTADAAPFAITTFPVITPINTTGTAVAVPIGTASEMEVMYDWTALGAHPVMLGANEGIVIQNILAGPVTTGKFAIYLTWEWAEVASL